MEKFHDHYIRFYECCKPVLGARRAMVHDFQRGQVFFIAREIVEVIESAQAQTLGQLLSDYAPQRELLLKQLEILYRNELIFFARNPEQFIPIPLRVRKPNLLEFICLQIDSLSPAKLAFLRDLDRSGVNNITLMSSQKLDLNILEQSLAVLADSKLKVISLIAPYDPEAVAALEVILQHNTRIRRSVFYHAPEDLEDSEFIKFLPASPEYIFTQGVRSMNDFTVNLEAYLEARSYNLFYFQKVFIGDDGTLHRYYGDEEVLGNVFEEDLVQFVKNSEELQALWGMTKDSIASCSQCEFRYICPDNRIPEFDEQKQTYVHQSSCAYDPQTMSWQERA